MFNIHERSWSPYAAGIVIGLLQFPAFLLVDTALGTSSAYVMVAGYLASIFDAGISDIAYFEKYMSSTKYVWQAALVFGIVIGAFLSMRLGDTKRQAFSPIWKTATGITSFPSRAAMAFLGGFVLLFGARLAGGCTSGHGVSGLAQLAVGSTVAVVAMFAGGILMAATFKKL
ncbi:MAG: YeeE/YedE thiosulfate transporter family protein [Hyphomicrobiaceae bacterium]